MPNKKGLGKGLSAIFGDVKDIDSEERIETISVELIVRNPYQPRENFDDESLRELARSIKEKGVIQPIVVRQKGDKYELVVGERRLLAAKRAGLGAIPAIVRQVSDAESAELALIENLQRKDLDPIEEALAYKRLMDHFGYTQEEVAKRVGKDRATVANALRLLALPDDVKALLKQGKITAGHARALLALKNEASIKRVAQEVIEKRLSVRETERAVKSSERLELSEYEERAKKFHSRARIVFRNNSGRLEIPFSSLEELKSILERMGV